KRGQKSNQTNLHTLKELGQMIDAYTHSLMNNAYLQRLDSTPAEAYNARVNEAVRIHEYELCSKLSPLERRAVNKKGIAYGGLWYQSAAMFAHTSVFVAANINNTKELFMYDEQHRFIGVASNLDSEEMSAEMARNAQKIFYKELKTRKGKMQEARAEVEAQFPQMLLQAHKKMPKTHMPTLKAINDSNLKRAKLLDEARKNAVGAEILDTTKEVKNETQTKNIKDVSWEAAVLKARLEAK
ncbi:Mu transposase C-terminal domain-containing protein, partial [Helicobacter typhlonius]|uniref:Mu transposase C-terminal domain-containing protein n=3 Tax=Helicobacter typhlonius TaxID=76936 RepID=UPI002FE39C9E